MPIKFFRIDGEDILVEDVMSGKRPTRYPLTFLAMASDFRAWDGKPHVTDLLNGDRLTWLKNRIDYSVDPDEASYRIFGTQSHSKLEAHEVPGVIAELDLETDEVQGRTDLIGVINGEEALIDYKVVGSYKIQQSFGIYYENENVVDGDGNPVLFKTGAKKGQQKTRKVLARDQSKIDIKDFTRQLNIYRLLYKKMYDKEINSLYIFAIVRDGGTQTAISRGVIQKTYTIPIPLASDSVVEAMIKRRSNELKNAMASETPPPVCGASECWDGRRCQGFCEVADACGALGDNPYLKQRPEEEDADE